jgi:dephospho-CoA kinase
MTFLVGLTGGIGSGKTAVSDHFSELGVPIVDTDVIAREVVEPGQPALREILEHFGKELLSADGLLDRDALRNIVFKDPEARR